MNNFRFFLVVANVFCAALNVGVFIKTGGFSHLFLAFLNGVMALLLHHIGKLRAGR